MKKHTLEIFLALLFARYPANKWKYNYDKSIYVNANTDMDIFCNGCGHIFSQKPKFHLRGSGCPKCVITAQTKTHEQFVEEANKIHNFAYDYLSRYVNKRTKIVIQHKSCGYKFVQKPDNHLRGQGCPKCGLEKVIQGARHGAKISNENAKIISDAETGFYINSTIWNSYKKGAKERNLPFDITPEDILELYKKQNGLCAFTGAKLICNSTNSAKNNWSIDRLYSDKGYTLDNIVLDTKTVNIFRNRSTPTEFLEICNMVASAFNTTEKYFAMSPEEKAERLENHSIRFVKKKV